THLVVTNGQTGVPRIVVDKIDQAKMDKYGIREVMPMTVGRVLLPELDNRSVLLLGVRRPAELDSGKLDNLTTLDDDSLGLHLDFRAAEFARNILSFPQPIVVFL